MTNGPMASRRGEAGPATDPARSGASGARPVRALSTRVAAGAAAILVPALAAAPVAAQTADPAQAPAAGRVVMADLPPLPGGPVCMKDRDWIVVEAEQYIARTTARAEDLSKKVIEQELAVERDPAAGRLVETTRADLRETLRRVRDAQGYREEARKLATRDCLVREGQGLDLRQAAASVAGAATAQPSAMVEPMVDVRLAQAQPCARDAECEIRLVSEMRKPAGDDRRVAVMVDLPTGAGSFVRSSETWNCYATTGGAVCLAKLADLKPGAPVESRLTWRLQASAAATDARVCTRTVKTTADGRPTSDPDRMRLLQAVLADYGYRAGAVDGRFADGTRVVLASAAPDFGIDRSGDDDRIAAALLGSMVSRVGVTTGPCLQIALASPNATDAPAPGAAAAAAAGAAAAAAGAATRAATPPRPVTSAAIPAAADPVAPAARKAPPPRPVARVDEAEPPARPAPRARAVPVQERAVAAPPRPPRPAAPVARAPAPEPEEVIILKRKRDGTLVQKRVVATEPPPRVVQPEPPPVQYVRPPVTLGIGLGRRGGFGIGF